MTIVFVGIDLAKNVFAVHEVDASGRAALMRPAVARDKLLALIAELPPCTIGMESCSGAHHWARQFQAFGHTVRLVAPKFVTPYRMTGKQGKNDAADAAAICEAIQRPHMRFVPAKSLEQQSRLMVHRARQPDALGRKYLRAGWSWAWFWVFPQADHVVCPSTGVVRRHHLHDQAFQRAFKRAVMCWRWRPERCAARWTPWHSTPADAQPRAAGPQRPLRPPPTRAPAAGLRAAPVSRGGRPVCWVSKVPRRGAAAFFGAAGAVPAGW